MKRHERISIRLKNEPYDNGMFFVTICTFERNESFGIIKNGIFIPNEYGKIVNDEFALISSRYENVEIGERVVMPNHVHFVVSIRKNAAMSARDTGRGTNNRAPTSKMDDELEIKFGTIRRFSEPIAHTLPTVIGAFKAGVTRRIRLTGYEMPVWQRGYWESIVRDEKALSRIRTYIRNNPSAWHHDRNNKKIAILHGDV